MNPTDLLADFHERRSEAAFAELVRRYTNLIYSIARRRLSNEFQAQEVTQAVFIRLSQATRKFRNEGELMAWLHRTTLHVSIDLWRSESRRRAREDQASVLQTVTTEDSAWKPLAPVIDEALNHLPAADRQAILLRFFDQKSMREVGSIIGITEDAAKMRVSRAIERLRVRLSAQGVTCSATALASAMTLHSVHPAPAALATALAALGPTTPPALGIVGVLAKFLHAFGPKLAAGMALVGIATAIALSLSRSEAPPETNTIARVPVDPPAVMAATASTGSTPAPAVPGPELGRKPDPLALLNAIARVRLGIQSGAMNLIVSGNSAARGGNQEGTRLQVLFSQGKQRFEQSAREYSYRYSPDEAEANAIRTRADSMEREAAVQAGLLDAFEARYVTVYDGTAELQYVENDGESQGTTIREPGRGGGQYLFDPRCLGLDVSLFSQSTVEGCLGVQGARSIQLIGEEAVEGTAAWHIQVLTPFDRTLDLWIDISKPERLLKISHESGFAVSRYDNSEPGNPLPIEVSSTHWRPTGPWVTQIARTETHLEVPVDPGTFTLAGLGMAPGTTVSDTRIHRLIGYWNGKGLSESLPPAVSEPASPPELSELLTLLEQDPASPEALDAALWILSNTPDGPMVELAAAVIQRDHLASTNLLHLCSELGRVRHRASTNLLEAILEANPSAEVRGTACFVLAMLRKEKAAHGEDREMTRLSQQLFETCVADYGQVKYRGHTLADLAKPELAELRRLTLGNKAPAITGESLTGEALRLGVHLGQPIVLWFWTHSTATDVREDQKLLERVTRGPFLRFGVNCDANRARAVTSAEQNGMDWPSFWDGADGPICRDWNVHQWPSTYVLDAKGVIRYRDVRGRELAAAVEAVLKE